MKIYLPDYRGGSIVNLMSSIAASFGKKLPYKILRLLPPKELKKSKNIVLIVIDGLGHEYLKKKGKNSIFTKHLRGKITSVFPSTTASAITTFATGLAPQQHGFTGWFIYLKELGSIAAILPFVPRFMKKENALSFGKYGIKIKDILNVNVFPERIKASSYRITANKLKNSDYTKMISKRMKIYGYNKLDGFFNQIKKAIKINKRKKYIFAYWPNIDTLGHKYGINSKKTEKHFKEIDSKFNLFLKNIKGTDSTIIVTADHGLMDSTKKELIELDNHPELKKCLTLPLCGDGRTVYCYVRPSRTKEFEKFVRKKFKKFCYLYKSEDLIKKEYFGLFAPNPKLIDRIGDYVIIMKKNYVLRDKLLGQKAKSHIGNHAGVSKEEMLVPLIVVKT